MKKLILILSLLGLAFFGLAQEVGPSLQNTHVLPTPIYYDSIINHYLEEKGIPPFTRKLIVSHARTESGTYTNNLVRDHNNLFGMKHPKQRPTKSIGPLARAEGRKGYAAFLSIEDSIEDYLLYLQYLKELRTYSSSKQYVDMLHRHYYFGSNKQLYLRNILYHNDKQLAYR